MMKFFFHNKQHSQPTIHIKHVYYTPLSIPQGHIQKYYILIECHENHVVYFEHPLYVMCVCACAFDHFLLNFCFMNF